MKILQHFHYQTVFSKGEAETFLLKSRFRLGRRLSLQYYVYFQFNLINIFIWHYIPSCQCLQDMFSHARLKKSNSCSLLETTTKIYFIWVTILYSLHSENSLRKNVSGCCKDGATVMLRRKLGFEFCE